MNDSVADHCAFDSIHIATRRISTVVPKKESQNTVDHLIRLLLL